ncbi:Crp/Fnr family transcriptional regulator [Staphylococcus agnetis]|uniref:Crp/Fnr family transcriptional regulator n=3 Tax=Staphylococcus agnetis TaxID=985762 RepID=UPI000CD0F031|nr:Crp/Fnr family transcriptional regulator [Staphylococcus agnetis]MCO4325726.1 Crp/Fnr family transcriptional regulator [Staphylococcus agnetis]MCO4356561.1 Crp/Fnr family transcriptional regulator [Staphylococcus agnetis]MCO4362760.1 Crp/Fnr family transcriptional regulator [Staphylococcus agnetis]MCO4369902.1 Crp/Fnr family transcriptional regulator [Staphylococcus agnetis]NJH68797.1 helix-turn-helix domain-containing protein [Staphylococcus agnetis]
MLKFNNELFKLIKRYGECKNFKQNEIVYLNNEKNFLYAFEKGLTFLKHTDITGKILLSKICKNGSIYIETVDEYSQFQINYHLFFKENTTLYQVSINKLKEKIDNDDLNTLILKYSHNEIKKRELILRDYTFYNKKGMILSNLVRLANSFGKILNNGTILIDINLTHEDLSQLCGMSRERTTKTLSKLKSDNVLDYDKKSKKFILLDLDSIKNQINCEECPLNFCNIC